MDSKKKKILIIALSIIGFIGIMYLCISIFVDNMLGKTNTDVIDEDEIEIVEDLTPQANEVVNFMLVGTDNLDFSVGRENSYVEERSDVFKLISLDYTDKQIKITSLDRDVVVWIPDKNEFGRFNWAYSFGGGKYAMNCINYNLDLDVSKYVSFSFKGFRDVIDAIGGIDVRLTKEEADVINGDPESGRHCVEGDNHLDGASALSYARIRSIDSDFERMNRQNYIITSVLKKFKDSSFDELFDVVNVCLPHVTTNLSNSEIKKYLFDLLSFNLTDIKEQTYPLKREDDVCANKDSMGGYILRSYSGQVISLHKFIYGTDDYEPTKRIYDLEKKTYDTYGEFYEGSGLIP